MILPSHCAQVLRVKSFSACNGNADANVYAERHANCDSSAHKHA